MVEVKFYWEEPVDSSLIAECWEAAFKRNFNQKEWQWRFDKQPVSGKVFASYILVDGHIASYYAVSPLTMITSEQEKLKSGLMVAGMTHPAYRRKGYFVETISKLNERLRTEGFSTIFAFANNNSHYSVKKYLNWLDVGIITNFTLNCRQVKLIKQIAGLSASSLPLTEDLLEKISQFRVCAGKYHIQRSKEYLTWRILQHPTKKYRAVGVFAGNDLETVVIYKMYNESEVDIMEIFWSDEQDISSESHLSAIISFLIGLGASIINIWSNLNCEEHLVLEKIGFNEDRFCAYFGLIKLSNQSISTQIADWHYRFLDSDVF